MSDTIIHIDSNSLDPIDQASNDRLQLLVFSASWCGPCKAMAPAIDDIAASYQADVAVAKIDIERSPDLANAFDVRGVPTLVMRRDGQEVKRHFGSMTRTRLALMLDDALVEGGEVA